MQVVHLLVLSLQLEAARSTARQELKYLRAIQSSSILTEKRLAVEDAKYGQIDATLAQVGRHKILHRNLFCWLVFVSTTGPSQPKPPL